MGLSCVCDGEERYSRALQEAVDADTAEDVRSQGVWLNDLVISR